MFLLLLPALLLSTKTNWY